MMLKRLAVVAFTTLTLACGDDRPRLRIVTAGNSFERALIPSTSVSPVAYVPFTITNEGNQTAFLPTCGSRVAPVVEQMVHGHWEAYASGFCILSVVAVPLELAPGKSHDDETAIGAAGHFRIRVPYSSDAQLSKHFDAVSWQFDVH